jgi:hypothetical protein
MTGNKKYKGNLTYENAITRFFQAIDIIKGTGIKLNKEKRSKRWIKLKTEKPKTYELILSLLPYVFPGKIFSKTDYTYDELYKIINSESEPGKTGGAKQSPKRKGTKRNLRNLLDNKKRHTKKLLKN